jgi:hypothetical protein
MKAMAWFSGSVVAIVLVSGLVLAIPFSSSLDREAIRSSAMVAVIAQMFAFGIAKAFGTRSFLAGWVVGVVLRFATLVVYGIVAVRVLAMPAPAALISLVTFLFLSTLAETKLLAL